MILMVRFCKCILKSCPGAWTDRRNRRSAHRARAVCGRSGRSRPANGYTYAYNGVCKVSRPGSGGAVHSSERPSTARCTVAASTYSRSLPIGMPWASLVTLMDKGLISLVR